MKATIITLSFLFSIILVKGQSDTTINFEGFSTLIEIDTSNADNIWQIGSPNKVVFDSSYSAPNAIVTDTIGFYPANNLSTFTYEFVLNGANINIFFTHKYHSQEGQDGGYIELSCDNGNTWQHLFFNPSIQEVDSTGFYYTSNLYSESDTIFNGKPAFSGQSTDWHSAHIAFPCMVAKTDLDCLLRFTFSSDSVGSQHEGWLIDDISISYFWCSGIEEHPQNKVFIAPNPISDKAIFQLLDDLQIRNGTLTVFDTFGRSVDNRQRVVGNRFEYDATGLKSGIYSYRLVDEDHFSATGKFVVK